MTQAQTIDALRTIAKTVNPAGSFIPGQFSDGSMHYAAPGDQIHLVYNSARMNIANAITTIYNIEVLFCRLDSLANLPAAEYDNALNPDIDPGAGTQALDSRAAILADMDTLANNFLFLLMLERNLTVIPDSVTKSQAVLRTSGGHTGWVLSFQLSTTNGYCNV